MTPFLICNALALGLTVMAANFAMALAGSEWQPLTIDGATVANGGSGVFVRFGSEGRVEAHGACRAISGTFHIDGNAIAIELPPPSRALGRGACADGDLEIEARFFDALQRTTRFNRDRIRLTLWDRDGAVAAELRQTDWD